MGSGRSSSPSSSSAILTLLLFASPNTSFVRCSHSLPQRTNQANNPVLKVSPMCPNVCYSCLRPKHKPDALRQPHHLLELRCVLQRIHADRRIIRDLAGDLVTVFQDPELLEAFDLL